MPDRDPVGVGIDVEDRGALDHLSDEAVHRAALRWLGPDELAWWVAGRQPRESLIVALSCKEAAWKAGSRTGSPADILLAPEGGLERGAALGAAAGAAFRVEWWRPGPFYVAIAVAFPAC